MQNQASLIKTSPFDVSEPSPRVSKRYKFVSTHAALDALYSQGFVLSQRFGGRGVYGQHYARLTHPDLKSFDVGPHTLRPEVVLRNSHDGSAALRLVAGFYAFACTNGLILGQASAVRLVHTGNIQDDVKETLPKVYQLVASAEDRVKSWSQIELTTGQERDLIRRVAVLRFSQDALNNDRSIVTQLQTEWTKSKRMVDRGRDLFTIYNKIQEHVIQGGAVIELGEERKRLRKLSGAASTFSVNQSLSDITEDYFQLIKQGA